MPEFGVAVPLCLICRALVGGEGATNNGTTIGPGTPTGAWWMWPAMNVSRPGLLICVLNVIVPSSRTLISVWRRWNHKGKRHEQVENGAAYFDAGTGCYQAG